VAFSINDIQDLIKLLAENPEWRAQLRPLILGDEFDRLPSTMQELADAQRRTEMRIEELAHAQRSMSAQVSDLVSAVKLLRDQFTEDTGPLYEMRFERKAPSLFGEWLRRPRVLTLNDIERFDEADTDGTLSPFDARQLRSLDLILEGFDKREADYPQTILAVEVSRTLDSSDLDRAEYRAQLLTRLGYRALPAVGGKTASEKLTAEAERRGILLRLIDQV
jgi:hypothetical protein